MLAIGIVIAGLAFLLICGGVLAFRYLGVWSASMLLGLPVSSEASIEVHDFEITPAQSAAAPTVPGAPADRSVESGIEPIDADDRSHP